MLAPMKNAIPSVLLAVGLMCVGCEADQTVPEIEFIRVEEGGEVVSEIEPQSGTDTTIKEDVPPDAVLVVEFSEPIDLTSAREKITLEDADGNLVDISIEARLGEVSITPSSDLEPELNHTLNLERGILDTSGKSVLQSLRVNFYTGDGSGDEEEDSSEP